MVIVFTIGLTSVLYYQFRYSFIAVDSILDAHENYYYSQMVSNWGSPPDSNYVLKEINNLHMWCGIFRKDKDTSGGTYPGEKYWSNLPNDIILDDVILNSSSTYFEELHEIEIPLLVYYAETKNNFMPVTIVDNGEYLFYLVINSIPSSEINNLLFVFIFASLFIIGLYFFISKYLRPVQLMKNRIESLEAGDLKSKIKIIGEDELADLSQSMNQLIEDIKVLLENKHQLLLEVSHEIRSPLARMQLLVAMIPEHKNAKKLKDEINFLEVMISNLLLSDRLSLPYSKLEIEKHTTHEILNKVIDMFPTKHKKIMIDNHIPDEMVYVDETKFVLALRNLLDNAFKFSSDNMKIELIVRKNDEIEFQVRDSGIGISKIDINKLTTPFYQANQIVLTKGFGLGLAICKKIIEAHKGRLSIESKEGKGSTFILYLPLY